MWSWSRSFSRQRERERGGEGERERERNGRRTSVFALWGVAREMQNVVRASTGGSGHYEAPGALYPAATSYIV